MTVRDFRRLLALYRPHVAPLGLAAVLLAIAGVVPGVLVFLIEQVLDDVLIDRDARRLAAMPVLVTGLYLVKAVAGIGQAWLTRRVGFRVAGDLRREVFAHTLGLDLDWHLGESPGARASRLTQDISHVEAFVEAYASAVEKPLSILALLAAALWMDVRLTLASLLVLPLMALTIDRFAGAFRRRARETLSSLAELSAVATEALSNVRVLKAFRAEPAQVQAFDDANQRQVKLQLEATMAQAIPGPVIEALAALGISIVIAYGGRRVFADDLLPGELIAFLVALGLMNMPMKGLSHVASQVQRALAGVEQAFAILDRQAGVRSGEIELVAERCELRFEAVGHDFGDGPVLQDVDFVAAPGELVALVGPSGAGKSTLASFVPRLRDPTAGRILLQGRPLSDYTLESLRRHVAVVSQEASLFDSTVLDNVRLGRPDATEQEVIEACRAANADAFIRELPDGYATRLQTGGMRLSGGQRQRICIARALLLDAPILVLDEATSALDRESEAAVQEALGRLMRDRTTLAIAHRLSTIRGADRILVLEEGRVVAEGPHDELMQGSEAYRRLHGLAVTEPDDGRPRGVSTG